MQRKTGIIGLLILLVVAAAAGYLMLNGGTPQEPTALRGYVGGEKIGLLEDEAVRPGVLPATLRCAGQEPDCVQ